MKMTVNDNIDTVCVTNNGTTEVVQYEKELVQQTKQISLSSHACDKLIGRVVLEGNFFFANKDIYRITDL